MVCVHVMVVVVAIKCLKQGTEGQGKERQKLSKGETSLLPAQQMTASAFVVLN